MSSANIFTQAPPEADAPLGISRATPSPLLNASRCRSESDIKTELWMRGKSLGEGGSHSPPALDSKNIQIEPDVFLKELKVLNKAMQDLSPYDQKPEKVECWNSVLDNAFKVVLKVRECSIISPSPRLQDSKEYKQFQDLLLLAIEGMARISLQSIDNVLEDRGSSDTEKDKQFKKVIKALLPNVARLQETFKETAFIQNLEICEDWVKLRVACLSDSVKEYEANIERVLYAI
ncbi:MAG: hypothetical protein S4CHLAM27_12510 [Chlamydiia bacterium]|nr:hypothetical protein [Chlamydiia bacterium]